MTSKVNYGYFSGVSSGIAGNSNICEQNVRTNEAK